MIAYQWMNKFFFLLDKTHVSFFKYVIDGCQLSALKKNRVTIKANMVDKNGRAEQKELGRKKMISSIVTYSLYKATCFFKVSFTSRFFSLR